MLSPTCFRAFSPCASCVLVHLGALGYLGFSTQCWWCLVGLFVAREISMIGVPFANRTLNEHVHVTNFWSVLPAILCPFACLPC